MIDEGETPLSYENWIKENNIDETKQFETHINNEKIEWKYITEDSSSWKPLIPVKPCDHDRDDGKTIKEPNCIEKGQIEYTCSKCNEHRYEEIPVDIYAHKYVEGICVICGGKEVLINDLLLSNESTVVSYSDDIEGYLEDETPNVRIHNYKDYQSLRKAYNPATIDWDIKDSPRTGFRVQYSLDENFKDYFEISVDKEERSADLYNLLLGKNTTSKFLVIIMMGRISDYQLLLLLIKVQE